LEDEEGGEYSEDEGAGVILEEGMVSHRNLEEVEKEFGWTRSPF